MPNYTQIQLRRDTSANWVTANPVLAEGEIAIDLSNNLIKIGDGTTNWNNLEYLLTSVLFPVNTVTYNNNGNSVLNHSKGNSVFELVCNGTLTTIVHQNVPSGVRFGFELHLRWISGAITFPASWNKGDSYPTLLGNYVITGVTIDGGISWKIAILSE